MLGAQQPDVEVTLSDERRNQFMLTLWDDFGEIEGAQLEAKMQGGKEFSIILGRNIGISPYQGFSLQTRFNSTIRINPTYPQALALISWAKTNINMLSGPARSSFTGSSTVVAVNPVHQRTSSIAKITSTTSVGIFYIEAQMSIADDLQDFCVLEFSGCKQKKRTKERKQFECPKCQRKTTLVPRCTFQVDVIDGTASTTASISGELAEKLLSMTANECKVLSINSVQQMLSNKTFHIQLRKSSWKGPNGVTQTSLTILSYTGKEDGKEDVSASNANKRNENAVEVQPIDVESTTPSSALLLEPSTLLKKV